MPVLYWLIAAAIFLLIEIMTMSLASIWFVGGALAGALLSYLQMSVFVQVAGFIVVTALMLAIIMPLAKTSLTRKKHDTNIDSLIGATGLVIQEIDNLKAVGQVNLQGQIWTARSFSDDIILKEGQQVIVQGIAGVKLIVIPKQNGGFMDV